MTPRTPAAAGEVADLQRDAVGRGGDALGIEPVELAAEHLGDDLVVADTALASCAATVLPLRKMVSRSAMCADLGHAVRDEDDQLALGGELAGEAEQPLGFARRQRRGRLVEDEDARVLGEPLGDLDDLPFGQRQPPHFLVGLQRREIVFVEQRQRLAAHLAAATVPIAASAASRRNQMFCSTVRSGISDSSWKTAAMPARLGRVRVGRAIGPAIDADACRRRGARRPAGSG